MTAAGAIRPITWNRFEQIMKHTPERIEEEAALVWAGVHEAVLLNGTPDSLERFREKRMIRVFREDL